MEERYEWNTDCADLELARLERGFDREDFLHFAGVQQLAFQRVQAAVHVRSGRLRGSGHSDITESTSSRWSGEISFGGGDVKWAASEFFGYGSAHGGYPSHAYFRVVGWQPMERHASPSDPASNQPHGDVRWNQGPISNAATTQGSRIEDDMQGPVTSFISRGRRTPHPHRPLGDAL